MGKRSYYQNDVVMVPARYHNNKWKLSAVLESRHISVVDTVWLDQLLNTASVEDTESICVRAAQISLIGELTCGVLIEPANLTAGIAACSMCSVRGEITLLTHTHTHKTRSRELASRGIYYTKMVKTTTATKLLFSTACNVSAPCETKAPKGCRELRHEDTERLLVVVEQKRWVSDLVLCTSTHADILSMPAYYKLPLRKSVTKSRSGASLQVFCWVLSFNEAGSWENASAYVCTWMHRLWFCLQSS